MKAMRKILAGMILCMMLAALLPQVRPVQVQAAQLNVRMESSDGTGCGNISDDYFYYTDIEGSTQRFEAGTQITLTSDEPMTSIYIKWYYAPDPWTLRINGTDYPQGRKGYVQEYVEIPKEQGEVTSATIVLGQSAERIVDIYAFSQGALPEFVHVWEDPWEEADILLLSTHADDEILFFGGIIPTYADKGNVRIQVAYFTDFFQTEPYRVQELLDGLWCMGVTHHPQLGEFYDHYSESYEEAAGQFDYDSSVEYMVRTIRRFKPQVVIGQDFDNGEYGHGGHMWCARALKDALEITADAGSYPASAGTYGTWDVPKAYFHLYPENMIELDARVPLARFGGRTALEVAREAYGLHESQSSWMWFQVNDGYDPELAEHGDKLNCTKFGLYRSLVGADTGDGDILEHITVYNEQGREVPEAEPAAEAPAETPDAGQGGAEAAGPEDPDAPQDPGTADTADEQALAAPSAEPETDEKGNPVFLVTDKNARRAENARAAVGVIRIILIVIVVIAAVLLALYIFLQVRKKNRRRRKMQQRAMMQRRARNAQGSRRQGTPAAPRPRSSYDRRRPR